MKISIGSDHGGFQLKKQIIDYLQKKNIEIIDVGCHNEDSVDYPDYGYKAAHEVSTKHADYGIAICKSGIGMSMVANKVKDVRAALCINSTMAKMSRLHNNANMLVLGASHVDLAQAQEIINIWLETEFEGGRHEGRVKKIHKNEL